MKTLTSKDAERAIAILDAWLYEGEVKTLVHNDVTEQSISWVIHNLETFTKEGSR